MTLHEEVLSFARDYVNNPKNRTPQRKQQIKTVYKEVFGELFNVRCGTCYIAALIKLVKHSTPKPTTQKIKIMASLNYQLKPGAILQAFGHRDKNVFKSVQLTDELAEWHLKNNPGCIGKFSKVPPNFNLPTVSFVNPGLKIVPVPEEVVAEVPAEEVKPVEKKKQFQKLKHNESFRH